MEELYIDEKEALTRLGGNRKLYMKVLRSFLEDKTFQKLEQCINEGDMQNVQRDVHTIKGLVANLSLKAA